MYRKLYTAWLSHIREGGMVLLESAAKKDLRQGRVLVRVEVVKPRNKLSLPALKVCPRQSPRNRLGCSAGTKIRSNVLFSAPTHGAPNKVNMAKREA